jgi:hypothetical protein
VSNKLGEINMKLIYIFILSLFIGCVLEPGVKTVYKDRVVNVGIVVGNVPLEYSYTQMWEAYSYWKDDTGMLLWVVAQNLSDTSWYGRPELRIYTTDEPMDKDRFLTRYDLVAEGIGVLTTDISPYYTPVDTVEFIPGPGFRHSLTFAKIDRSALKQYYYALWRFVPDNTSSLSKISSIKYDQIKWQELPL